MSQTGEQMSSMAVLQQQSLIKGQQSRQTVKPICTQLTGHIQICILYYVVASRVALYCLMIALKMLVGSSNKPELDLGVQF